jgi:DNA polymerase-3 subunit epsilon
MSILIFDLETTGLLPPGNPIYLDLDKFNCCRIVSIAWSIYTSQGFPLKTRYHVIKPHGFSIDDDSIAAQINKITRRISDEGSNLKDVWDELANDLITIDLLIAHNIKFDRTILLSELARSDREDIIMKVNNTPYYCTMINTIDLCKLPFPRGGRGYKFPKLQELHHHLFGYNFFNDHNANADVEATARCYFELKNNPIYNGRNTSSDSEPKETRD